MAARRSLALVLLFCAVVSSMGASARTQNFVVHAPNLSQEDTEKVGRWAEHYRREKAKEWLGQEMPTWAQPCPLHVQVNMDGPSGATSFMFGPQGVTSQKMEIQGPL